MPQRTYVVFNLPVWKNETTCSMRHVSDLWHLFTVDKRKDNDKLKKNPQRSMENSIRTLRYWVNEISVTVLCLI